MDYSVSIVRKRVDWDIFADALQIGKRVCPEARFTICISVGVKDKPKGIKWIRRKYFAPL